MICGDNLATSVLYSLLAFLYTPQFGVVAFFSGYCLHNQLITRKELKFLHFAGSALGLETSFIQSIIEIREQRRRRREASRT
jgi:hypothetical protein